MGKTNAVRLLDRLTIQYKLLNYDVDIEDLSAQNTAKKLNLAPEQLFKTLVIRGNSHHIYFTVIPSNARLNLKAVAKLADEKKVEAIALKELKSLTGYIRGGVTAIASKKDYPVFVDETITALDSVAVSAGVRGTLIMLAPQDYLNVAKGKIGAISTI
jgi:Cys-tRNA(Pro)/Cys-tRNA(Cys) deacylase